MIVSGNLRLLLAAVILALPAALPCGSACGQNYAAIERRLGVGVAEGELTLEQAARMLEALRAGALHQPLPSGPSGQASQEPDQGLAGHFKEFGITGQVVDRIRGNYLEAGIPRERIDGALTATLHIAKALRDNGKIEIDQHLQQQLGFAGEQLDSIVAVASELAQNPRREQHQEEKRMPAGDETGQRIAEFRAMVKRIQAAVESGELSPEEAEKKLIQIREEMFGEKHEEQEHDHEHSREDRLEALENQLKEMVERGELTEEEAKAKWQELKKKAEKED